MKNTTNIETSITTFVNASIDEYKCDSVTTADRAALKIAFAITNAMITSQCVAIATANMSKEEFSIYYTDNVTGFMISFENAVKNSYNEEKRKVLSQMAAAIYGDLLEATYAANHEVA